MVMMMIMMMMMVLVMMTFCREPSAASVRTFLAASSADSLKVSHTGAEARDSRASSCA